MSAIYRSYEVLVEETASNHKTRSAGKTTKDFKPHFENTCRALKVTHELFQDAVCYYILCLVGLVKNERDKGEPINRMWEYLHSESKRSTTNEIATHLGRTYFKQSNLGTNPTCKLLEFIYASIPAKRLSDETDVIKSVYQQLANDAVQIKKQGKGKNAKTKEALADMAKFANNWLQRLAFPDSKQGGAKAIADNNAYWLQIANELKTVIEPKIQPDFDDGVFAEKLKLEYCFNTPAASLHGEDALRDYGKAFAVIDASDKNSFWEKPPKTVTDALARYANPYDSKTPKVRFEKETTTLLEIGRDPQRRSKFVHAAASSQFKPSGTYWASLRYKFAPSPETRLHLYENIKMRKATDATDALDDVRKQYGFVFPFFTNLLGLKPKAGESAVWTTFDKSAFKRAAEEVFKYRLRSNERVEQIRRRLAKIEAMNGTGEWTDAKGKPKQLGGIAGDEERPRLMRQLLDKLGGAIGYGMRRATIGGWADLRQKFLEIAKKDEPIDEDDLLAAIEKAREDSAGGFGSGALFKALCEEEYHPLWLEWKNKPAHHPKNFVRWWVLYSEAKEELKKVWDEETNPPKPKPIAFTWPSTENRHGETSFRPLDFDAHVTPSPVIDLFDQEQGKPLTLVKTNTPDENETEFYPLTISFRRLKRDKLVLPDGSSMESYYDTPLAEGLNKKPAAPTVWLSPNHRKELSDAIDMMLKLEKFQPVQKSLGKLKQNFLTRSTNYLPIVHRYFRLATRLKKLGADERKKLRTLANKFQSISASASLLPPGNDGCWHFMFSFKLETDEQKKLIDENAKIPGDREGSVRKVKKNGKWIGLNLRWPIDLKTENPQKKEEETTVLPDGEEIEETDAKFSVKKIWCSKDYEPFDILSVDLGVRYAGAWCRGRVKIGRDAERPNQRKISPDGQGQEIFFDAYDFGTFRLQGEDAKIWRKDKHKGFSDKPEPEKCGSRGRIASEIEKAEFAQLAGRVFPATKRLPIPDDPAELKFFPDLGDHLTYRLRRQLGRIRFLFKLRWQISGTKRGGHNPKDLSGEELKTFRSEQRFNVIASLAFIPKDDEPEEGEDDFMRELRLKLASDELWTKLVFECEGETHPLFSKIKGGGSKDEKVKAKQKKAAQKAALAKLKGKLESDSISKWNWSALAKAVQSELMNTMTVFAGEQSLIAEVARFVWPLQDKKWKWTSCEAKKDGKQSVLERDKNSNEPKRFIHGMRGLNMKRIRLMQDFRQCCQSLAKLERRFYREDDFGLEPSPVRPGDRVHEPAPAFLDKINELREQRVNQTAHMILAEALGLELMNPAKVTMEGKSKWELKSERDLHGRYKHKNQRVAAIILEDLSRYRTSQDRSRYENSQLMEWSHRAIIGKLQDMAQVFGVQIITVDARFSSRFCSRTGVPGIRCAQVAKGFENDYPWKKWKEETAGKADADGKRKLTERANMILLAAKQLTLCENPKATLLLPIDGGPAFLPIVSHDPKKEGLQENADIGAAVNIGLRPIAHPDRLDVFPVLRTEAKADGRLEIKNRRGSLSEAATVNAGDRTVQPVEIPAKNADEKTEDEVGADEELESGKFPYLYAAVRVGNHFSLPIDAKERYQLPLTSGGREVAVNDPDSTSAAKGKDFWWRVKRDCWTRIKQINSQRLKNLGIEPPKEWTNP